ncbi:MAG: glycosyltransferase [Deltaproteobacteria bacterium]|nr:glycosyltransferase [Deltaproteobacteria bacterium]
MPVVLHLIETLGHGGAEEQLALCVGALDPQRFQSVVVQLGGERSLAARIEEVGVPTFDLRAPRRRAAVPYALWRLLELCRRVRPALIHTSLFEADLVGGIAASRLGAPVVTTLCTLGGDDLQLQDNPNTNVLKHRLMTDLWGRSLRAHGRRLIAISRAAELSAIRHFGVDPSRIEVIYRAATLRSSLAPSEARVRLALRGDPLILTVGRLVPEKGQRYLIEAMPRVLAALPSARLYVAGKGPLERELVDLARAKGVSESVFFLGYRSDVNDLLAACDLFVFPSLWEGLGVALVEAVGMGRPCIATSVGAMPEIVEHERTGLLVPPRDARSLAEAIVRLGTDRRLSASLASAASAVARERFDLARITRRIEAVYDRALAEARGG